MSGDNYKILYSSKDQFYVMVSQKFSSWYSQLEKVEKRMNAIIELEEFKGAAADAVKSYIQAASPAGNIYSLKNDYK